MSGSNEARLKASRWPMMSVRGRSASPCVSTARSRPTAGRQRAGREGEEGRKSVFTQTANCLGNRRGEEVSRLCVCLLQLPAQKEKKPRIRFQPSTTAESRRKRGKDGIHTGDAVKFDEEEGGGERIFYLFFYKKDRVRICR